MLYNSLSYLSLLWLLILLLLLLLLLLLMLLYLSIGDTLVTINGANVSEMGVDIVRNLLSNYPPGDITLEVVTDDDR